MKVRKMKRIEVINFLERIKVYYPQFTINGLVKDEWTRKLEPYDFDDCCMKLDEHLAGEDQDRPPMPNWIIKYLKTQKEKSSTTSYKVICPNCGKPVNLEDLDGAHYNRCLSTSYIIRMKKKYFNKETDIEEINALSDDVFWDKYYKFLEIISQIEGFDITKMVQEPSREDISNRINQMTLKI